MAPADETAEMRLRLAFDLFEASLSPARQRFRRERPGATEAEIEMALEQWLRSSDAGDLHLGVERP